MMMIIEGKWQSFDCLNTWFFLQFDQIVYWPWWWLRSITQTYLSYFDCHRFVYKLAISSLFLFTSKFGHLQQTNVPSETICINTSHIDWIIIWHSLFLFLFFEKFRSYPNLCGFCVIMCFIFPVVDDVKWWWLDRMDHLMFKLVTYLNDDIFSTYTGKWWTFGEKMQINPCVFQCFNVSVFQCTLFSLMNEIWNGNLIIDHN